MQGKGASRVPPRAWSSCSSRHAAYDLDCQPIVPGTDWDLDHADGEGNGYLGPSHARCNRAATQRDRRAGLRWSRRWFEDAPDAPDGTVVVGKETRKNGEWHPI